MKKLTHDFCLRLWAVSVFLAFLLAAVVAVSGERPQKPRPKAGQLSEAYLKYLQNQGEGGQAGIMTREGYTLGAVPSHLDFSHLTLYDEDPISVQGLPAYFDLRNNDTLTDVRDQGSCGSCWAFATMGALEAGLMPNQEFDFSEQHLIKEHRFKNAPCKGGSIHMSVAYLARWDGPLSEEDMPYTYVASALDQEVRKHVQNVVYIPANKVKAKRAIKRYGPVYVTMCYDSQCYNPDYASFYNSFSDTGYHAVLLVGWDNSYSRYKFNSIPPGDGAFIVRNSWGPDYGEQGYFYISYYDQFLGFDGLLAAFKKAEPSTNYKEIYEYDTFGLMNFVGYDSETAWCANVFTAQSDAGLRSVSFYALGTTTTYTVYVYKGVRADNPVRGTLAAQKGGRLKNAGYYTIPLKSQVPLSEGERFSVVVKLNTKNHSYPIPVECHVKGETRKARVKARAGEGFISYNGTAWNDVLDWFPKTSVCVKAFTK